MTESSLLEGILTGLVLVLLVVVAAIGFVGRSRARAQGEPGFFRSVWRWRGILADESARSRLSVFLMLLLLAFSMTFLQFGFIGIGLMGHYQAYVMALIAPIAVMALLLGKWWSTLGGLISGAVLLVHARFQPLDLYEFAFVTGLNSIVLYGFMGLVMGVLFAVALHRNPGGVRRYAYLAIVSYLGSYLLSNLFGINILIDMLLILDEMRSYSFGGRDLLVALLGMGDADLQILWDFAVVSALSIATDAAVRRYQEVRSYRSVRVIFRTRLLVVLITSFLAVASVCFAAITMECVQAAAVDIRDTTNYLVNQLNRKGEAARELQGMPEYDSLSDESFMKIVESTSTETLLEGRDIANDGTIVVFSRLEGEDSIVQLSNSPAYPIGESEVEIFGSLGASVLSAYAESGEIIRTLYTEDSVSIESDEDTTSIRTELGYLGVAEAKDYYVMAARPDHLVFATRSTTMLWTTLTVLVLLVGVYIIASRLVQRSIVDPVDRTNASLGRICEGDLDEMVSEVGSVEFASLSAGINTTVDSLKRYAEESARRIEHDLATARAIQVGALPKAFPAFPDVDEVDLSASMDAAKEVGGDFYDFFEIDEGRVAFLIADVSGKGIPGALFMMAAKAELQNYLISGMEPAAAVAAANRNLCAHNEAGMFVTVWAATLDWRTGELTYVNAGHNFPLLRHGRGGSWEWLKKKCGLFLGTFETAKYRQESLLLEPGDELLLYTDGVNEAFSVDDVEYGNDRLEDFLAAHADLRPQEMVSELRADVAAWAEGAEQSDDVTILAVEYRAGRG